MFSFHIQQDLHVQHISQMQTNALLCYAPQLST